MTLYEINDILFNREDKEMIEKSIIEFISRFLDEEQTSVAMSNRELGMFETFKLYENFEYEGNSDQFVEETLSILELEDVESYLLTHILKLHGWAGFIKYRSEDPDYYSQQVFPSSLIDYIGVRLYYERVYLQHRKIHDFKILKSYIEENSAYVVIKILKHKGDLPGKYIDELEESQEYEKILESYVQDELRLDARQVHLASDILRNRQIPLVELAKIMEVLREDEGYIWLKSHEDTYINSFINEVRLNDDEEEIIEKPLASATFCLDVRSETMRRYVEHTGPYKTYGAGGFLGVPIAFVEFDKAHEQFLCPAVVKPGNIIFEIPVESYEEYSSKKGITKTTKQIIKDLKNNPYTPYVMIEAIGWIFGINLFGKTFAPKETNKFFSNFKAKKPKTTYTLSKLTQEEIELYVTKLHEHIISNLLQSSNIKYSAKDIHEIRDHLLFKTPLNVKIASELLEKLKDDYKITAEDYEFHKKPASI
jgi:uncharacterized protein YbcC (UPF0753/DUF2309 family)